MKQFLLAIAAVALLLAGTGPAQAQYLSSAARLRQLEEKVGELIILHEALLSKIDEKIDAKTATRIELLESELGRLRVDRQPVLRPADLSGVEARIERLERLVERLESLQRRPQPVTVSLPASSSKSSSVFATQGAAAVPSRQLAGRWRLSTGDEYRCEHNGALLRLRLIRSERLRTAEAHLAEGNDGVFRGLVTGVYTTDPSGRKRSANLVLRPRNGRSDLLDVDSDQIVLDRLGNEVDRRLATKTLSRLD